MAPSAFILQLSLADSTTEFYFAPVCAENLTSACTHGLQLVWMGVFPPPPSNLHAFWRFCVLKPLQFAVWVTYHDTLLGVRVLQAWDDHGWILVHTKVQERALCCLLC